ncbi:unnamed protein product [Prunus armeniaca]|uniref:Uncharacterized protein n=1 Tax=Prunus armeniaca TaxID=36596 RepID=A0A6J5V789_PRUAR|nr:unnamed protein product [Prunus armeniaca]CAB4315317.1 unnamed protein product [Prunus armeniaca]
MSNSSSRRANMRTCSVACDVETSTEGITETRGGGEAKLRCPALKVTDESSGGRTLRQEGSHDPLDA